MTDLASQIRIRRGLPRMLQGRRRAVRRATEPVEKESAVVRITRNSLLKNQHSGAHATQEHLPLSYILLVFVLSIPFWLIGGKKLPLPMRLPASSFMWVNPLLAASLLTFRAEGRDGVKSLLKKAVDYRKIRGPAWYLAMLLVVPFIYFASYGIMRAVELPLPKTVKFPAYKAPLLFLMFFLPAMSEELGWSGYAIDPLQRRWNALKASIVLGVVWQIWHVVPDLQAEHSPSWIAWHSLYSVALRVLIVWNYNNSGKSVFAAALVHTMDNVSWSLFPNDGSHLDPRVTAVVAWIAAAAVIAGWGPKTLAHYRYARANR